MLKDRPGSLAAPDDDMPYRKFGISAGRAILMGDSMPAPADQLERTAIFHSDGRARCLRVPCGDARWRNTDGRQGEGDTVRPGACARVAASYILITCPSRISFLRISPPPACICLFLMTSVAAQGPRQTIVLVQLRGGDHPLNTKPADAATLRLASFFPRCKVSFPGLDLVNNIPQAGRQRSLIQHIGLRLAHLHFAAKTTAGRLLRMTGLGKTSFHQILPSAKLVGWMAENLATGLPSLSLPGHLLSRAAAPS
ncbi:hypothetical protein N657DRAFT_53107 [Parathielavia appendiculata]|uniref:Uncharacterized protein n=1 Tax=Parathielavia appendiculata TaxID=2587402 RepID=A0AAN6UAT3_9PEZI|nr:hypothetical protein N657DRAFT_53107 [Parathielavia appendiculata]